MDDSLQNNQWKKVVSELTPTRVNSHLQGWTHTYKGELTPTRVNSHLQGWTHTYQGELTLTRVNFSTGEESKHQTQKYMSHITRKCVFENFRQGNIQTSLLS